ncbi:hypothetical protein ColLi_09101 [Colletotrichum liriopes]|uniref:Uncharacterized protein n=1 Tax=Colletotrichum liriopes TaxID=708192 RepID=A0AA37LW76_9PEZI|nr:hypothetical protein ColLi_09101 [Colletotrichum liriopes]
MTLKHRSALPSPMLLPSSKKLSAWPLSTETRRKNSGKTTRAARRRSGSRSSAGRPPARVPEPEERSAKPGRASSARELAPHAAKARRFSSSFLKRCQEAGQDTNRDPDGDVGCAGSRWGGGHVRVSEDGTLLQDARATLFEWKRTDPGSILL